MERRIPVSQFDSVAEARQALREESLRAMETQSDYIDWLKTGDSRALFRGFIEAYGYSKISGSSQYEEAAAYLHWQVTEIMKSAPTYFVSHDMTEMISMAAEDMPRDGLSPIDLLTDNGFLLYDHPLRIKGPTEQGTEGFIDITAVGWQQSSVRQYGLDGRENLAPGITYYLFTDSTDLSRFTPGGKPVLDGGEDITPEEYEFLKTTVSDPRKAKKRFGPVFIYDFSGWAYGQEWAPVEYGEKDAIDEYIEDGHQPLSGLPEKRGGVQPGTGVDPETGVHRVAPVVDDARRLLSATWKMLSQKVVTLESQRPPRAMRRRVSRNIPDAEDVTVVRLRREYHPEGGEDQAAMNAQAPDGEGPWYSHRFLVKGHWRRQHHGPNGEDRKLVWIAPYVKGPEDRPLILGKKKVWSLEQ